MTRVFLRPDDVRDRRWMLDLAEWNITKALAAI